MFQDPIAIWILAILIPLILFFVVWRYFKNRPADPAEPTNLGGYQPKKRAGIEVSNDRLSKPDDRLPPPTR